MNVLLLPACVAGFMLSTAVAGLHAQTHLVGTPPANATGTSVQVVETPPTPVVTEPSRPAPSSPATPTGSEGGLGAGWLAASRGYQDYSAGRFESAATEAELAVKAEPQKKAYRYLLINALNAAGRADDTLAAVQDATAIFGPDEDWLAVESLWQSRKAAVSATAVYRALEKGDLALATDLAREAVQQGPDLLEYRMLLVDLLVRRALWPEAEVAVTGAISLDPQDPANWLWRAVIRHFKGDYAQAVSDFEHAMALPDLDDVQHRWLRLLAIDAAVHERDWSRAEQWLSHPVLATGADDEWRTALGRRQASLRSAKALAEQSAGQRGKVARSDPLVVPVFRCRLTPYGRACLVVPGIAPVDKGFDDATEAYKAVSEGRWVDAQRLARNALALAPENSAYRQLLFDALMGGGQAVQALEIADQMVDEFPDDRAWRLMQIRLWGMTGQLARGKDAFRRLMEADGAGKPADLDMAYLAIAVGDDESAQRAFEALEQAGDLKGATYGDAAFSALRLKLDDRALNFFRLGVDSLSAAADADNRVDANSSIAMFRRASAEVSRQWGATLSLTMSRELPLPAEYGLAWGVPSNSTVAGFETYWRPFGYRNGENLEAFFRGYATLHNSLGGATGWNNGVGSLGVRWQPVAGSPIVLAGWRQLPFGPVGDSDWVVQASFFKGWGTDIRDGGFSWWTGLVQGEWSRALKLGHTYTAIEGRVGRTWKLDEAETAWGWQPFASLKAERNSQALTGTLKGLDVGLSVKRAFGGDAYTAPRSTWELEWRHRIQQWGAGRSGGVVKLITTY